MAEVNSPPPGFSTEAFRPLPLWARLLMTMGPLAGFALILLGTSLWSGDAAMLFLLSMTVGGFMGGGKLVTLTGAIETAPVDMWGLAGLVVYGDIATALVLMANMHYLYRVPFLGRRLAAAREAGFRVLAVHRWMRRAAELGLAAFIAVPFQGTGAVLGVVLGRLLGLSRFATFFAILAGSTVGCSLIALLGRRGRDEITQIANDPYIGLATVGTLLLATFFLGKWFLGQNRKGETR